MTLQLLQRPNGVVRGIFFTAIISSCSLAGRFRGLMASSIDPSISVMPMICNTQANTTFGHLIGINLRRTLAFGSPLMTTSGRGSPYNGGAIHVGEEDLALGGGTKPLPRPLFLLSAQLSPDPTTPLSSLAATTTTLTSSSSSSFVHSSPYFYLASKCPIFVDHKGPNSTVPKSCVAYVSYQDKKVPLPASDRL